MTKKPKQKKAWEKSIYRGIVEDIRGGKTLEPTLRNLVANELEEKWFPPSNGIAGMQERANLAWLYAGMIDLKIREVKRSGEKPRGGLREAATASVAEYFGISVEALDQRIKRGKREAIKLGMSINKTLELSRRIWSEADEFEGSHSGGPSDGGLI